MICTATRLNPAQFLMEHVHLLREDVLPGPVLDLACGDGRNGIFLAHTGVEIICADLSVKALGGVRELAAEHGVRISIWRVDLEQEGLNPLPEDAYGAILVFRYLHRPLIPCMKKALRNSGLLIYETFTVDQRRFGKPHNPNFLLKHGELRRLFEDWEVIDYFEGIKDNPARAVAQLIARKPATKARHLPRE